MLCGAWMHANDDASRDSKECESLASTPSIFFSLDVLDMFLARNKKTRKVLSNRNYRRSNTT